MKISYSTTLEGQVIQLNLHPQTPDEIKLLTELREFYNQVDKQNLPPDTRFNLLFHGHEVSKIEDYSLEP